MKDLRKAISREIAAIPALPLAAAKAMQMLKNTEQSLNDIIKLLEYDSGATANILKAANSAASGPGRSISSTRDAIVRLGMKRVLQALVSSSVSKFMKKTVKGYDLPPGELWKSSVAGAAAIEAIRDTLAIKGLPDYVFTATLMRDIGKIVLGSFININASEIIEYAQNNKITFPEAEKHFLGMDHAEAGAILLGKWNLPKELVTAVQFHHSPETAAGTDKQSINVIHLADSLTVLCGIGAGAEGLMYRISPETSTELKLNQDLIEKIVCATQSKLQEIGELLG